MRLGLPSCTTYAGTTQGRVILHIYCVQNKPNTWLALGRRRPIIFFFRSSSFVVVKALSLTSMFRLESSVSKKSCLRCTRTWCFGGQQKKTTNNNNFFFFFRPSCFYFKYFMLSTLIDYLVFNASTKAFFAGWCRWPWTIVPLVVFCMLLVTLYVTNRCSLLLTT